MSRPVGWIKKTRPETCGNRKTAPCGAVPAVSLGVVCNRYTRLWGASGNRGAYIDGFNLYYGIRSKFGRRHLWLDVVELVRQLRPNDQISLVRYFSAIVRNEPQAADNQVDYLEAMCARNGALLDVHLGRFRDRRIGSWPRCGQRYLCACGRSFRGFEEKETDVALGVTMVADAALGRAGITLLISADTDPAPALSAIREVQPHQRIYIAMPPGNAGLSPHLSRVGNIGHFFIPQSMLRRSQMPDTVIEAGSGRTYKRPSKWV